MISERGPIWTLFAMAAFLHIQGIGDAAELPDREPPLLEIAVQKVLCAGSFIVRENEFVSGGGAVPAIRIRNSSGVTVEGNRLRGPWDALDEAILVDTESVRDTTIERNEVMVTR